MSRHSKSPASVTSTALPPNRITPGFIARTASTTSLRQPPIASSGISRALSSQSVPGPRNSIEIVARSSVAFGTSRASYFAHSPAGLELALRVLDALAMEADSHGFANSLLHQVDRELAGDPLLERDAVLGDAERAGDVLLGDDPV